MIKGVIKILSGDVWSQLILLFKALFNLFPLLIISSHPLFKKTRLSTDPEAGSPGRGLYTRIEDGHVSINEARAANDNEGTYYSVNKSELASYMRDCIDSRVVYMHVAIAITIIVIVIYLLIHNGQM